MPSMREHIQLSRRVMSSVGLASLGLAYQRHMDRDPSLPQHRLWDHTSTRLLSANTPEEVAEWVIHLAVDFGVMPDWGTKK